jgi:uncharacterized membrane protein
MKTPSLKLALGLSLALNLLLVSGIAGAALMWSRIAVQRPSAAARAPLRQAADGLAPEHRAAFRATVREANRSMAATVQQAREDRRRAAMLFVQPTFDAAAVSAALDGARAADIAVRTRLETAIVGFAATLPAGERSSLAEGLRRGGPLRRPNPQRRGNSQIPASPSR